MSAREEVNPVWAAVEEAGWRFLIHCRAMESPRLLILDPQRAEMIPRPPEPLPPENPYWPYKHAERGSSQEGEMLAAIQRDQGAWSAIGFIAEAAALAAATPEPTPNARSKSGRL